MLSRGHLSCEVLSFIINTDIDIFKFEAPNKNFNTIICVTPLSLTASNNFLYCQVYDENKGLMNSGSTVLSESEPSYDRSVPISTTYGYVIFKANPNFLEYYPQGDLLVEILRAS